VLGIRGLVVSWLMVGWLGRDWGQGTKGMTMTNDKAQMSNQAQMSKLTCMQMPYGFETSNNVVDYGNSHERT
jgi:hypothetical protein